MVLPAVWAEKCERYSLSMPYKGRYCTGDGIVIPLDAPRLCQYQCILSATCKAYNYNATVEIYTCFSSPCPQALGDPAMEFSVFTQRPYEQCYEWIPYNTGDSVDERMIYVDTSFHIIARRQMTGNDTLDPLSAAINVNVCASWKTAPSSGFPTPPVILYHPELLRQETWQMETQYLWQSFVSIFHQSVVCQVIM